MKVDLSPDAVDSLMRSILIQDYKSLCSDIRRLEDNKEKLEKYQLEDLEHNLLYKIAFEKLMEYYIGFQWEQEL